MNQEVSNRILSDRLNKKRGLANPKLDEDKESISEVKVVQDYPTIDEEEKQILTKEFDAKIKDKIGTIDVKTIHTVNYRDIVIEAITEYNKRAEIHKRRERLILIEGKLEDSLTLKLYCYVHDENFQEREKKIIWNISNNIIGNNKEELFNLCYRDLIFNITTFGLNDIQKFGEDKIRII